MPPLRAADIELTPQGMRVTESELYLDARRPKPLSFVSHAHADHVASHAQILATASTAALMAKRLRRTHAALTPPYGQPFDLGSLRLSLHPAGHVRGSAQLLVQRGGRRLLYTGDLGLSRPQTAEPAEQVRCDVLVLEATFGHPRYRLPSREEALAQLDAFIAATRDRRETPVLLAYPLGKSQEVIAHLGRRGVPVRAERSIREMTAVYRELGCELPMPALFEGTVEPEEVLLITPYPARGRSLRAVGRRRSAVLTGFAVDPGAARRYGADAAIPLSDHADFDGLCRYASASGASKVYTVHGFCKPLAKALREQGLRAQPLVASKQLDLFE